METILPYMVSDRQGSILSQMVSGYKQNHGMPRKPSIKILAKNLNRLMAQSEALRTNVAVAKAASTTHSHVRRMRKEMSAATIDMLDKLAAAFGVQPYELLMEDDEDNGLKPRRKR